MRILYARIVKRRRDALAAVIGISRMFYRCIFSVVFTDITSRKIDLSALCMSDCIKSWFVVINILTRCSIIAILKLIVLTIKVY